MDSVYIVITEDRHHDVQVDAFESVDRAVDYAVKTSAQYVNRYRDRLLSDNEIRGLGFTLWLSRSLEQGGWLWYCAAYEEGPTYSVKRIRVD